MKSVHKKIDDYFKKKTLKTLLKGGFLYGSMVFTVIISASFLAYYVLWSVESRKMALIFVSLCLVAGLLFYLMIPIFNYFKSLQNENRYEKFAREIGALLPPIKDHLVNYIQLEKADANNVLVLASIKQRINNFNSVTFTSSISFRDINRFLRLFLFCSFAFISLLLLAPNVISEGFSRIINYKKPIIVNAPFTFVFENQNEKVYKNEDFTISLKIEGNALPNETYIELDNRKVKMNKSKPDHFTFTLPKVQRNYSIKFLASGYESQNYVIQMIERPELMSFGLEVTPPSYTLEKRVFKENSGSLTVLEGSTAKWTFITESTDSVSIFFLDAQKRVESKPIDNQVFTIDYVLNHSTNYDIDLKNKFGFNHHKISYSVDVIKDQFPELDVQFYGDTILFDFILISGIAKDDYGISKITINYQISNNESVIPVGINQSAEQSFYHRLSLNDLPDFTSNTIELFVSAWDNDGVNGTKSIRSQRFVFKLPSSSQINETLENKRMDSEKQLSSMIKDSKSLNEKLKDLEQRLISKPNIEWQEEKMFQEVLDQKNELENQINELKEKFKELNEGQDKFNDRSDALKEKAQQLEKLMNELLDEETKKLYDELQKLMEEKAGNDQIRDMLKKINPGEKNMEKELERMLELFKKLQIESKLEKAADDLQKLSEKQEKLSEELNSVEKDALLEKQNEIKEEFKSFKEDIKEIQQLNQELKNPESIENTNPDQDDIEKGLDQIEKSIDQGSKKESGKQMKSTSEQMKSLGAKLSAMQASMEMEMMQENIEDLQNILDNLIKLSFSQERIMDGIRGVQQVDPRFVELSQEQLSLKDNSKIIEDSLLSLANRIASMSNFVTRELSEVNRHMDESLFQLRERNRSKALSSQQFSMTSMNNLALLLSDLLKQLQMAMSEAQGNPKPGKQNPGLPNMKQLQEQLSKQIEQLKDSGMKGRELSEELARMAAEQEMLRNQLQEMQEQMQGQPGNKDAKDNLGKAIEQMEQNEIDLVNKRLTQQLINRQEQIMTRLLEAEKSMKEQDLEEERKGESAMEYDRNMPKAFEEYLKAREKELEMIKNVPIQLSPFYKKEVNSYFRRLSKPQ